MKSVVLYHKSCIDGYAAAFSAWLALGDNAEYIPVQYNEVKDLSDLYSKVTLEKIKNSVIYILDFSFPLNVTTELFNIAKKVVWLDHHKTAFEMWCGSIPKSELHTEFSLSKEIILDNTRSGAMITWMYFHPEKEVPRFIRLIDDYDRWKFRLSGTKEFNKAAWLRTPWTFKQWKEEIADLDVFSGLNLETLINEGELLLRAHNNNVQSSLYGASMNCTITLPDGTKVMGMAANCPPHLQSDVGHELATKSGTFGLLWYINKDKLCLCSLRSNGLDVSAIARAFEGGGHLTAAGMTVPVNTLLSWLGISS